MVFCPSDNVRFADQDDVPVADSQFISSTLTSTSSTATSSEAVPVTVTDAEVSIAPSVGDAMESIGTVVS